MFAAAVTAVAVGGSSEVVAVVIEQDGEAAEKSPVLNILEKLSAGRDFGEILICVQSEKGEK